MDQNLCFFGLQIILKDFSIGFAQQDDLGWELQANRSRICQVQNAIFIVDGDTIQVANFYTFKFDMFEFFWRKIHRVQTPFSYIVKSRLVTGHTKPVDYARPRIAPNGL